MNNYNCIRAIGDTSGSLIYVAQSAAREGDVPEKITITTQETCHKTLAVPSFKIKTTTVVEINTPNIEDNIEKKPSYLNLACCVNGYSRLTAYDSIFRKNLSRTSRELSPINIITNPIQLTQANNFLVSSNLINDKERKRHNNNLKMDKNSYDTTDRQNPVFENCDKKSFIQERVERLYGPDALTQNLFSPKQIRTIVTETSPNSPLKYSTQIDKNFSLNNHFHEYNNDLLNYSETAKISNNDDPLDLPVLRHLRPEFRAQLSIVSPKKDNKTSIPNYVVADINYKNMNKVLTNGKNSVVNDIENGKNDHLNNNSNYKNGKLNDANNQTLNGEQNHNDKNLKCSESSESEHNNSSNLKNIITLNDQQQPTQRDGAFFLKLLRSEQNRLLDLANETENDLEQIMNNPEITEDMLGYLRSASGKAKLLVSKKMKQFEGLCNKNMNPSPEEQFITTAEDLQGFWDMIYLQIDHVDALFNEIEQFKKNEWKKPEHLTNVPMVKITKRPNPVKTIKSSNNQTSKTPGDKIANAKKAASAALAAQKREAQRKQFLELKRKNKLALGTDQAVENNATTVPVELFVNENCT